MKKNNKRKLAVIIQLTSMNTGQSYIGCTSQRIEHWMANLVNDARRRVNRQSRVQKAIRKEGIEAFKREILDSDRDYRFARDQLLPMYIDLENTYKEGLNTCKGGFGIPGYKATDAQKAGLSRRQIIRFANGDICSNRGLHWVTNGFTNKMVSAKELVKGLAKGWKLGWTRRAKIFQKGAK
jgi:hypothetical protein